MPINISIIPDPIFLEAIDIYLTHAWMSWSYRYISISWMSWSWIIYCYVHISMCWFVFELRKLQWLMQVGRLLC